MVTLPIHPDDILLFREVTDAMRIVAKNYNLPLGKITGMPMPKSGMIDRMGDCCITGDIRLVLRCTENGEWCDAPLSPDTVWDTAAHELAHLRHMNHGEAFQEFWEELHVAMGNQRKDHKDKILDKLVKLQKQRQSEAELGNSEAAEAFAGMINKMLIQYELNPTDIDYAHARDNDPVVEIMVNRSNYGIDKAKVRSAWQEALASSIAEAHLCRILISPGSNIIVFVGTKSHATVAEYVYGTMVPAVEKMSKQAELKYWHETGCGRGVNNKAKGYRAAWIDAFIKRIWERFAEARRAAVAEAAAMHGTSNETGLIRLDGALLKVKSYIENKFNTSRAARHAGALRRNSSQNAAGHAAGRDAADNISLGKRGLTGGNTRKQIGS